MTSPSPLNRRIAPWLGLCGLVVLVFIVMRPFIGSLAWACILAYATWPLSEKLRKKCGEQDTLAAALSTVLAAITLFGPLLWLAWLAQQEVADLLVLGAVQLFVCHALVADVTQNLQNALVPLVCVLRQGNDIGDKGIVAGACAEL